jgi:phage anti-repressor protein
MNELIKIQQHNGKQAVSARELYDFLEVGTEFAKWCTRMFDYGFEEDKDFTPILTKSTGGRPSVDYALTLDCAKEIAMIQRTPQGKQAREYFITCEKKLREIAKPLSTLDMLEMSIKQLRAQEQKLTAIENDVLELKAATQTRSDYFTIVGYATLNKMKVGLQLAAKLGGKASRLCREYGYQTEEIPDPRFGKVKMYPKSILQQVFTEAI